MATAYTIRIHELADDTRSRLISFFEGLHQQYDHQCSYAISRETDATRTHFQGWLRCGIKHQALRVRIKKAFPECVGNRAYSVGIVKDFEKYSRYILKGTREEVADVVTYHGIEINEQVIANEHRIYWSTHGEKPSKSQGAIVKQVEEWYQTQGWEDIEERRREVARRVCDVITSHDKPLNIHYARYVYNSVMYRNSNSFRDHVVEKIIFD